MTAQATELANLDKTRQAHIAALNAGDADGWAACFAADAVQMPPNDPPNVGAESIQAWSGAFLAAFHAEFSLFPDEVKITLAPRTGGSPISDAGKYITIYHRQADGTWVMARDIWNSSNPLPGLS
jgi:ketosteroid isomerase-like protein